MARILNSNAIECLMYAILCTCPDVSFVIGLLSHFQLNPDPSHWSPVKRVLRCLRGINYYVYYGVSDLWLHGYIDTDYIGDLDERN